MALSTIICTILLFYYGLIPAIAQVSTSNHIQRYYLPPPMNFTPMHFECFDEDERPNDEDIENFVWYINRFNFDEADIGSYSEVTFGKKKADLTILALIEGLFVEDGNTIIRCEAKVKPNKSPKDYRIYEVIPGELPNLKLTDVNGMSVLAVIDVEENTTGKISCEAEGGVPPISVMQLYLDNSLREETKNSSIISFEVAALHFPDDQDKTLKCRIETVYESAKHKEVEARLNIKAAPRISIQNKPSAEEGKSLTLKVQVLSNPASSVTWHLPANISGEGKNIESNVPKWQLAQKDGSGVWEITLPEVKKEYFGIHLIIRASNELGEKTLSYPILSATSSSGPSLSSVNQIREGHFLLTGYLLIVAGNHLRFLA